MVKNKAIKHALRHLEERLGKGAFQIVDHWEADMTAVGIADPFDTRRVVYIASGRTQADIYHGSLEKPAKPGSSLPYEDCGTFNDVDLDELVQVVSRHLDIGR